MKQPALDRIAQVGDTIRITTRTLSLCGEKLIVTYSSQRGVMAQHPEGSYNPWSFLHSHYEVVESGDKGSCELCHDCNGTGKIQLFTSTIKCSCT
jgi:hypothetical protein